MSLMLPPEKKFFRVFYRRVDNPFVFRMDLVTTSRQMAFHLANYELECRGDGDYCIEGIVEGWPQERRPPVMQRDLT
jgi:hypothetical protein